MSNEPELISVMRRGMTAAADRAPDGSVLAERIVAETELFPVRQLPARRRAHGWPLAALAAMTVAAVAAGGLVGSRLLLPDKHRSDNAPTSIGTPSLGLGAGPAGGAVPAGFRPVDVSFINRAEGWALGSVPCGSERCTQLVRTRDGGTTWVSIPAPPLALQGDIMIDPVLAGCNPVVCVSRLRFATSRIGYLFTGWQLFMTVDGGASWQLQAEGGAADLAIADGTAWWLSNPSSERCEASCHIRLRSARLGSTDWRDIPLPAEASSGTGVELSRASHTATLVIYGAGGAAGAGQEGPAKRSTLVVSTDDGANWTVRGEPCPNVGGGADSLAPRVAPDASMTLLCRPHTGEGAGQFTITSTDGGASFVGSAPLPGPGGYVVSAASSSVVFTATDRLYRSADHGRSWQPVSLGGASADRAFSVQFQTTTTGQVLVQDAHGVSPTIWTTTDAGATWTSHTFR
ncbi:MAG: hypothetical protein ABJB98_10920 [Actinomycetota bacterium]